MLGAGVEEVEEDVAGAAAPSTSAAASLASTLTVAGVPSLSDPGMGTLAASAAAKGACDFFSSAGAGAGDPALGEGAPLLPAGDLPSPPLTLP